jgi:multicomponent Na+:H+ antiporter subunit G
VKLFAIMLFLLFTGPTATYALANAALLSGLKPDAGTLAAKNKESAGE